MIITDEKLLRLPCSDVLPEEVGPLIDQLERELENSAKLGHGGIGLAAIQIGIQKNIAIVRINDELRVDLVNCKLEKGYDEQIFRSEGCLSFPGRIEDTMRYQEVYITQNLVYPHSFIMTGLSAVVCQHELDHLNGILLPDKAIKKVKFKVGPNEKCPCGSNLKFKRCCGK